MAQARGGFKTKLYRDAAGDGSNWQQIAEVLDINGPELTQVIEDATHMDSPDGYAEKIAVGLREAGDITLQLHLLQDDASQLSLRADLNSSTVRNYRIVLPTGTKRIQFSAFVASLNHSFPMRGKMVHDLTLSVTGKPTYEAHS